MVATISSCDEGRSHAKGKAGLHIRGLITNQPRSMPIDKVQSRGLLKKARGRFATDTTLLRAMGTVMPGGDCQSLNEK
jgi:hypothetical protein